MVDRRTLLMGLPASAFALSATASYANTDPILTLYREWLDAKIEWNRLSEMPGNEDFDWPESIAAEDRAWEVLEQMVNVTPSSSEGMAALIHIIWYLEGSDARPDTEWYREQMKDPGKRAMLTLWRAASGQIAAPRLA